MLVLNTRWDVRNNRYIPHASVGTQIAIPGEYYERHVQSFGLKDTMRP